jgi:hypothetical protein
MEPDSGDAVAEGGSNAGSDFAPGAIYDAGSFGLRAEYQPRVGRLHSHRRHLGRDLDGRTKRDVSPYGRP